MKRLLTTAAICLLARPRRRISTSTRWSRAAKAEPPTTVYAVTGKIVDTAATAFNEKYGLNVTGKKVNEAGRWTLIREHQAGPSPALSRSPRMWR